MSNRPPKKKKRPRKRNDLVLTPGGWRSKSRTLKVEPGQHAEVQEGRLKVIDTETGKVVADLGAVGRADTETSREGVPMKKAERPKTTT